MSWIYRRLVRPVLFSQDPERAHSNTLHLLGLASRNSLACECLESFFGADPLPTTTFGLTFPNPIGLAAGMDKEAAAVPAWSALGFGFTELGAVTWHPQPGNPAPRVFRAVADEAIINRMGFNNPGAEAFAQTLQDWRSRGRWPQHPVGINLGKSKVTPLDRAAEDYANSFRVLQPLLDFFVINVSSPNTPNLRQLQDKAALDEILAAVESAQAQAPQSSSSSSSDIAPRSGTNPIESRRPVLVKVAPDLSAEALDEIVDLATARGIAGLIATNTTITRPRSQDSDRQLLYAEAGGLSGKPLRARSTEVIRHLYRNTQGRMPIIGVGGIFSAEDAWEKITAGACLVQVYTGLVYEGPGLARSVVAGLRRKLAERGMNRLDQAIGIAAG
jgi:dihydroorotate dehydrogenase